MFRAAPGVSVVCAPEKMSVRIIVDDPTNGGLVDYLPF
ncbi:hypothetical protein FMEAI12_2560003 [Parafrankia sp. Ea1.12]|nr:hypothetical protein FMEAI12_2560003 [Parafrankia sp. Ea1.12]